MSATLASLSPRIPARLAPAARGLWLLMAAASFVVFAADQARLAQAPVRACPTPTSGCNFNSLAETDLRLFEQAGLPAPLMTGALLALSVVARLSLPLVGAFVFWRRPDDWVAWLLSLSFLSALTEGALDLGRLQLVADLSYLFGVLVWLPLPFVFPNGRLEPRPLRWLILALMVVGAVAWTPALGQWLLPRAALAGLSLAVGLAWAVLAAISLFYRYRYVSNAVERQQTKWVIAGFMAIFATSTTYLLASALYPPWQPSGARVFALIVTTIVYAVGYGGFALATAFSILRYRLWDIDLVVRRTLVYGALTGLLALLYWGAVSLMQQVLRGLTGTSGNLAIIVSTLFIAAMFQPLRRRLQHAIDRRFYRGKYDTAQTLADFAATARDSVDLDELTASLQAVVASTMQPAHSSLWLRPPGQAAVGPGALVESVSSPSAPARNGSGPIE